jgi:hypothetical protein
MAGPKQLAQLSQFWLPTLLFVLSVVSILFTLRNDEIPVIGPSERPVLDSSDLEARRLMINQALLGSGNWRNWCEAPLDALQSVRFAQFQTQLKDPRWADLRRYLPQAEQDAFLRCQNLENSSNRQWDACLYLVPQAEASASKVAQPGLYLLEMTVELRAAGKKNSLSCREALASTEEAIELTIFYSYYWTSKASERPLHFDRLTGGTRIFPPLAQNIDRSAASSRP